MTAREPGPRILALAPAGAASELNALSERAGWEVAHALGLAEFLGRLQSEPWTATLLSMSVEPVDEAVALSLGRTRNAGALLLSSTAVTFEGALMAERVGAVALVGEPLSPAELAPLLAALLDEGAPVPVHPAGAPSDGRPLIVGESEAMAGAFRTIAQVADSSTTVLITGESGTGKEIVARALHWASGRRERPFVPINCAAVPEGLLESELFGHERGAFTGASTSRAGRFERADGGTLFLDEIGDMSVALQAKVLRVLEERSVERVGGSEPRRIDVRVIAATNAHLGEAMADGRFRRDLYFRLAVVELALPALRQRAGDVRRLALHFAGAFAEKHGRPIRALSSRALERLEAYPWPGNVRELRNVLDRAVLLAHGDIVRASSLHLGAGAPNAAPRLSEAESGYPVTATLAEVEAAHIGKVLASVGGQVTSAAEVLGIHRNTLARKLREIEARAGGAPVG